VPQDSHSISSGAQAFFKAQGTPVTLELPLPSNASANRIIPISRGNDISVDDDSAIRRLAARLGLHQCFGPSSVEMLVQDLAIHAHSLLAALPMKEPLPAQSWNFVNASSFRNTWFFYVDNPRRGNNAKASSYSGARRPRLELIGAPPRLELISNHQDNSAASSLSEANPGLSISALVPINQELAGNQAQSGSDRRVVDMEIDSPTHSVSDASSSPITVKRRRGRVQTPVVDDEVRRSARLRRETSQNHIQLDNEPRRKKGASKKSMTFSSVDDLKKAIISSSLEESLAEFEVAPIPTPTLVELGHSFCGVPPTELSIATILHEEGDQ
jgi:hypothetical protein